MTGSSSRICLLSLLPLAEVREDLQTADKRTLLLLLRRLILLSAGSCFPFAGSFFSSTGPNFFATSGSS